MTSMTFNSDMSARFLLVADLLEAQAADPNRVRAYRAGADTLQRLDRSVVDIHDEQGIAGLIALPTIGRALAMAIVDVIETGRWRWLDRLRGEVTPEVVLASVPGIGAVLASRIHEALDIESLEDLEVAAHDGRLEELEGFGSQRVRGVIDALAGRLGRRRVTPAAWEGRHSSDHDDDLPTEVELLDVDREYHDAVALGDCVKIAPRRFNPSQHAWLPVLHTARGDRHYTVMFSNTAQAHALDRVHDWVVIYEDGPHPHQWTVVTATSGRRHGERVVRGSTADSLER